MECEKTCVKVRALLQLIEMLGDDNRLLAAQALGHSPDKNEAILYYIEHGGAEDFAKRWGRKVSTD